MRAFGPLQVWACIDFAKRDGQALQLLGMQSVGYAELPDGRRIERRQATWGQVIRSGLNPA